MNKKVNNFILSTALVGATLFSAKAQNNQTKVRDIFPVSMECMVDYTFNHDLSYGTALDESEVAEITGELLDYYKKFTTNRKDYNLRGIVKQGNNMIADVRSKLVKDFGKTTFTQEQIKEMPIAFRALFFNPEVYDTCQLSEVSKIDTQLPSEVVKTKKTDSWGSRFGVGYMHTMNLDKGDNDTNNNDLGGTAFISLPVYRGLSAEAGITFGNSSNYTTQDSNVLDEETTTSGRTYKTTEYLNSNIEFKLLGTAGLSATFGNRIPITLYGGVNIGSENKTTTSNIEEEVFFDGKKIGEGTGGESSEFIPGKTTTGMNGFYGGLGFGTPGLNLRIGATNYNDGSKNNTYFQVGLLIKGRVFSGRNR